MHLDEAREMIQRALQIEPNNGSYLDSLGWVEFRRGNFDQALADLLRAVKNLDREDAIVFEHLGDTYLKLHRLSDAVESWEKAFALDPQNKRLAEKIQNAKTMISSGSSAKANSTQ
jgi:tetratricopeptide (TPR) repeat protein